MSKNAIPPPRRGWTGDERGPQGPQPFSPPARGWTSDRQRLRGHPHSPACAGMDRTVDLKAGLGIPVVPRQRGDGPEGFIRSVRTSSIPRLRGDGPDRSLSKVLP